MILGVYTLEELKAAAVRWRHPVLHRTLPICPYFLARRLLQVANVVVLNYQYLLDPKVSEVNINLLLLLLLLLVLLLLLHGGDVLLLSC